MAWGSTTRGTNRGDPDVSQGLDALKNPFTFISRTAMGGVQSVDDILRGLGRAGGAILSDVFAEPVRGLIPGGDPGFWRDEEDGAFRPSTYSDVLQPIGKSFANTVDTLGDLTYLPNLIGWDDAGTGRANEQFGERLQQLNDDPFNFLLEHVGNAAIVGGLAAKPAQLGIASSKGAITGSQAARGLRPLAGRGVRTTARQVTREAATEAAAQGRRFSAPQVAGFAEDVVGHPYRTAAKKVGGSRAAQLIKDPRAFDPVTKVGETLDNLGDAEPTVRLFRGMSEEFDPARVPEEGARFTDDIEYALSNTNEGQHQYLYEVEVPESRVDIGTSDFADLMGEGAGPRGARLGIDELEGLRRVDPEDIEAPIGPTTRGAKTTVDLPEQLVRNKGGGSSTDPAHQLGVVESVAQGVGYTLEGIQKSKGYQAVFGSDARGGRRIRDQLREGSVKGTGRVAEAVREKFFDKDSPVGNVNVRRKWDPSRVERLLLRDLKNLGKRDDAGNYARLVDNLEIDQITARDAPRRVKEVVTGERAIGQTLDPEGLLTRIQMVLEEAHRHTGGADNLDQILKEMLPGVDPMGLHLLALNALEKARGLPENSLTSALTDYVSMDRFADTNRQAQALLRGSEFDVPSAESARFRIPEEELGVDLNALGPEGRQLFEEAAAQWRREQGNVREPMLVEEGLIPEAGTRIGLASDQPTQFPTALEDLPLSKEWRQKIRAAQKNKDLQQRTVDEVTARLEELATPRMVSREGTIDSAFNDLAEAQRGAPEQAMRNIQSVLPGGVYSYVVEHVGDLIHRMSEAATHSDFGYQNVSSKVRNSLNTLKNPYGFMREFMENIEGWYDWAKRERGFEGTLDEFRAEIKSRGQAYADRHRELPTYNEAQRLAQESAVAIGEWRFDDAVNHLEDLAAQLDTPESWSAFAGRVDEVSLPERLIPEHKALYKPRKGGGVYRTQTGEALKRHTAKLRRETKKLETATRKLEEVENAARVAVENAPVSARNLLVYGSRVATEQAKALRAMADSGVGNPEVYRLVADELDAVPKTIDDLNSAEVYLTYLRDMKDKGLEPGELGPTTSATKAIDTRKPAGTRRRGTDVDIDYSRDFRARAYWQDSEFQSWFLARQADEFVREQGLAKTGKARLLETGDWTPEQIAELTPGQAQQALERLGLRVYQPDQLFGSGRKPSSGKSALEAEWLTPFAEQNLMGAVSQPRHFERIFGEGIVDPVTNSWKVSVLPLRVGWQVNNIAGNALFTILVGQVSPFDYPSLMRASRKAVTDWNKGITNRIKVPLTDTYRAHLVAALQKADDAHKTVIQSMLDEDAIILSNEILAEIASSGLVRGDFAFLNNSQFLRDIGANSGQNILQQFGIEIPQVPGKAGEVLRNWKQTFREGVDYAYHLNEATDTMHRAAIYIDQIGKGVPHPQAMGQVLKALGDYNKLSGFEKRIIKRIYPFYPWMRHVSEVVVNQLKPDNITRTLIFTHMTNIFGEPNEWEALLPEWASGHIYMGMNEHDKPKFLSTRGLNPFLDVFDPVAQPNMRGLLRPSNPALQFGFEQMSGTSVLTGKPFSAPGQVFGSDELPRPPWWEYIPRNVPQLGAARDVYRDLQGMPLTRYGTGEAAFFEGAEEGRSSLQDVQQLFGYNVRPLDVEAMRERELVDAFKKSEAETKYQEQLEAQGGRQARDLLNALPGIGG